MMFAITLNGLNCCLQRFVIMSIWVKLFCLKNIGLFPFVLYSFLIIYFFLLSVIIKLKNKIWWNHFDAAPGRAQTESIHFDSRIFDSPMWIKNHKKILIREVNQNLFFLIFDSRRRIISFLILIHFDSLSKRMNRNDSFWFPLIFHIDSIWFTRKK